MEVQAETLYQAAALGLALLKQEGWVEGLGPATRLEIHVRQPATAHTVTVTQLQRWANSLTNSPADVLRKAKVKQYLGVR